MFFHTFELLNYYFSRQQIMKKTPKKEKKATNFVLLKNQNEIFELQEFHDSMDIEYLNRRKRRDEIQTFPHTTFEELLESTTNKSKFEDALWGKFKGITSVPYVLNGKKNHLRHQSKEVEITYFKPKTKLKITNEKEWMDKSFNLFYGCIVNRTTFVVEENEDKLKISLFRFNKKRSVGHKYFAKHSDDLHITFNRKTKNFFITTSKFFNRKRHTSTFKNSFKHLLQEVMRLEIRELPNKILKELKKVITIKLGINFSIKKGLGTGLAHSICEWYIKVRKIKVPNNYFGYLVHHYPGIRKLKKFKMNLGRTILNEKELRGRRYIKLINTGEYNLTDLKKLERIFGKKYFSLIPNHFLKFTNDSVDSKHNLSFDTLPAQKHLTKYEKLNLIKVLGTLNSNAITNFISLLVDHLRMQGKIWSFNDKIRIKAKTLNQFNEEHAEWANLIHLYERNDETQYHYDSEFIKIMEEPLSQNGEEYDVKVLKNDLEYFEEGQTQKHCVRTYLNTYSSIIISIRETNNTINRMTCEFKHATGVPHDDLGFDRMKDYNLPRPVQSRLKFNALPVEETWKELNKKINKRFMKYCNTHKLTKPKIEVHNKVSGHKRMVDIKNNGIEAFDFVGNDLPF